MVFSVGKAIRELNNKINHSYFLSGDDYFLQSFFIENLNKKFDENIKPINLNLNEESDINLLLGELSTINMFSDKNIYVIRNINKVSSKKKNEILKLIEDKIGDNILVFISEDFYTNIAFFKSLTTIAQKIDTRTPFIKKTKEWINYYLRINNIKIDQYLLNDIIYSNNDQISTIINEIEKLHLINNCNRIEYEFSDSISKNKKNIRPWNLLDSIGNKDIKKSLSNLDSILYNSYSIIQISINLYNFFFNLYLFHETGNSSTSGLNKIISNNLDKYSNKYNYSEIKQIIIDLKNIDVISKTSNLNHKNLLTILIVKICYGYYR